MTCPCANTRVERTHTGPHYGKRVCVDCGVFRGWEPKPESARAHRPAKHRALVQKYGRGFCEVCLRSETDLTRHEWLEAHHIQPFREGGSEDRENILILCHACHSLVHWRQHEFARRAAG